MDSAYSAFSPELAGGHLGRGPVEALLNKPAPGNLFERVGLGPRQSEEVKRTFAREGATQDAWSTAH